jgi:hypothetical protein
MNRVFLRLEVLCVIQLFIIDLKELVETGLHRSSLCEIQKGRVSREVLQ